MSKVGVKFEDIEKKLIKDEKFKAEYERLKPRYELIAQIVDAAISSISRRRSLS